MSFLSYSLQKHVIWGVISGEGSGCRAGRGVAEQRPAEPLSFITSTKDLCLLPAVTDTSHSEANEGEMMTNAPDKCIERG